MPNYLSTAAITREEKKKYSYSYDLIASLQHQFLVPVVFNI
jgi:hypothetical protein